MKCVICGNGRCNFYTKLLITIYSLSFDVTLESKSLVLFLAWEQFQRFGPDSSAGGGSGTARDTRYLRDMVRELEETNEQLRQEIKDLNRDLNGEKRAAEKVSRNTYHCTYYIYSLHLPLYLLY